jgi:HK97 gp10 family phage protein
MNISWDVQGLEDLDKKLAELGAEVGQKVLRKAARTAMKPVKEQMVQTAPFDEGKSGEAAEGATKKERAARTQHLKDKISITTKKRKRQGKSKTALTVRVGPTRAHAQKAIAAEYGTTKQSSTPFMRAALQDNRELVVRTIKHKLAAEIEKITR